MVVNKNIVSCPALISTLIVRLLFWPPTIWTIILCVQRGYSLVMMHVLFSTIGCCLLLVEATLIVSGDAVLAAKVSRSSRVTIHWLLIILGLVFIGAGFGFIEYNKIKNNSRHFTSDHGKVGLVGYVLPYVISIFAIPTVCTKLLPRGLSLASVKYAHIIFGAIALIMLWAGQITGFYTRWWPGSSTGTILSEIAYVAGGFLLLIKPCYTTVSRIFGSS